MVFNASSSTCFVAWLDEAVSVATKLVIGLSSTVSVKQSPASECSLVTLFSVVSLV